MVKVILKKNQELKVAAVKDEKESSASALGTALRDARKNKNLTIERLSDLTKIPMWHLQAIEAGRYDRLPPEVYLRGVLKRLAKFLDVGLDAFNSKYEEDLTLPEVESGEASEIQDPTLASKDLKTFGWDFWSLTPKKITIFAGILFLLLIFSYLWYQYDTFTGPPSLVLVSPQENSEVMTPDLVVRGRTSGDAYLTVNGQDVYVGPDGDFSLTVRLSAGINALEIISRNRLGKENKVIRRVLYNENQNQSIRQAQD